jgi:hypothetical protein
VTELKGNMGEQTRRGKECNRAKLIERATGNVFLRANGKECVFKSIIVQGKESSDKALYKFSISCSFI